jgi:hypothetical protein
MLSTKECGMRNPARKDGCGRDSSPSGAVRTHVSAFHSGTRMEELLPRSPSPMQNGVSHHVYVGRIAHVYLLTTQYTNAIEKPG